MNNGKTISAEGYAYKASNGVNFALHKEGNFWYATETTSGKRASIDGYLTLKEIKADVESRADTILKLLQKEQGAKRRTISNDKNKKPIKVQTEEEYLAEKGVPFSVSDFVIDKTKIPHGETRRQREKRIKATEESASKYYEERKVARAEYNEKVKRGEIKKPTTTEKALKTAKGNEDLSATQAARRLLAKRGIDWKTGKKIKSTQRTANNKKSKKSRALRPNPFSDASVQDIYLTKNKIAVTTVKVKRKNKINTKTEKTKYYELNDRNKRSLRKVRKEVRRGRNGSKFETV